MSKPTPLHYTCRRTVPDADASGSAANNSTNNNNTNNTTNNNSNTNNKDTGTGDVVVGVGVDVVVVVDVVVRRGLSPGGLDCACVPKRSSWRCLLGHPWTSLDFTWKPGGRCPLA